ncbi:MAG: radical SAM protein [Cellulosilyticaceae bacterium]
MKISSLMKLGTFGVSSILLKRKKSILGTIILTDCCNLSCQHCAVNNILGEIYPYTQIRKEMQILYEQGIRILFFCGGETFLWQSEGQTIKDLVREAKEMGFLIVNVVTNGTLGLDLPEADLILVSMDGDKVHHNLIRGETYDQIIDHIKAAPCNNVCLYMAINQINKEAIESVAQVAKDLPTVRAVSFNFHTPYVGTEALSLTQEEKVACCEEITHLMKRGYPIFNLKSAFPYIVSNKFKTPCYQCVVMEKGKQSICGRCIEEPGLCDQCGYFFAAEYALLFGGNVKVIWDMLTTYTRYI